MNTIEIVGKIGSMALVDSKHNNVDYNRLARIGAQLKPGMVWVTSGATEIGRLDYYNRNGCYLDESEPERKTDYSAQGQAMLMSLYRQFTDARYSVRQVLVEHYHFNDIAKREHLKGVLVRAASQNAIPIINYNDCISDEETRKLEIAQQLTQKKHVYSLVDNDETAAQITLLLNAKHLIILTGTDGIYFDPNKPETLIDTIKGNANELGGNIDKIIDMCCKGSSRSGSNGAGAKLRYIKPCAMSGTKVYIASADCAIADIISGSAKCTRIFREDI